MHRKLFYIIHTGNTFQIYRGWMKILGPVLIDITFYMLNLDTLKTVLSTALLRPSLHICTTPHHTKDCERCSLGNMPLGQCWGCIYIRLGLNINSYHVTPLITVMSMAYLWGELVLWGIMQEITNSMIRCTNVGVSVSGLHHERRFWKRHGNAFHSTGLLGAKSTGHRPVVRSYESDVRQTDHIVT